MTNMHPLVALKDKCLADGVVPLLVHGCALTFVEVAIVGAQLPSS